MNGTPFKLATLAKPNANAFVTIVLGDDAVELSSAHAAYRAAARKGTLSTTDNIFGLLQSWDANFPVLQEIVAFLEKEGKPGATKLVGLRALPPVLHPGKMFYAAQNFQEHVDEMICAGMTPAGGPKFTGEKSTTRPYLFLKAPSCLAGANDDIAIPIGMLKIDWEAEIALAISKPGKRIKAARALDHVAGFMTTNDVSCRDLQIRPDRPGLRSDWLGGKSHDNFAPMGPFFVPRAFVPDHMNCSSASPSTARSSRTATHLSSSSRPRSRSSTPLTSSPSTAVTSSVAVPVAASARAPTPFSRRAMSWRPRSRIWVGCEIGSSPKLHRLNARLQGELAARCLRWLSLRK